MELFFSLEFNLVILFFLLIFSAFFSGVETALTSISRMRIKHLIEKGNINAKKVQELKENPQRLLITILLGNNVVNIGASSLATALTLQLFPSELGIAIATGIMTLLILTFGEITPKTIALRNAEKISLAVAGPLLLMEKILFPIIFLFEEFNKISNSFFGGKTAHNLTEAELRSIVSLGEEEGAINAEEKEMIHKIFEFNDIPVVEVMTPVSEIEAIESGIPIKKLKSIIGKTTYSRLPVYNKSIDNVLGILYIKDILEYWAKGKAFKLNDLLRKPFFVPETKKIDVLLKEMQATKTQIALVVNEHGGLIGVITIEDILEEIVGEIYDEDDTIPSITEIRPNFFRVNPQIDLISFNEKFGTEFDSLEFETVAGLIHKKLDRIPKKNDKIKLSKNLIGRITQMKGPRIKEFIIRKTEEIQEK
ncbi:MAG: HlyC/CorC family transporter [Candidatus Diapherotrites archaeon]|nr:HlyC/CorC family transporter [Candidatus Diapherotrites archaeon]